MKKFLLFSVLVLTACGTIFSGTTQEITFNANVPNTKIFIDGMEVCTAPCQTAVDRSSDAIQVVARKRGCHEKAITLRSGVNRTAFFNLIFWPSWLTDALSGGVWEYKSNMVYLQMEPDEMSPAQRDRFRAESAAKYFALFNYDDLRLEAAAGNNGELTQALSELSQMDRQSLQQSLLESKDEVGFVNTVMR